MNIGIVTSTFPAHPTDTMQAPFLLNVIEVLQQAGHQVSVLTQAREENPSPALPDLHVTWFPWRRAAGRLAELNVSNPANALAAASLVFNGARHARQLRRQRHIDLFLCCWLIPSGMYLYLDSLLARSRVPYLLWALGSDVNKYRGNLAVRQILRRVARRSAGIYADGYKLCEDVTTLTGRSCEFLPTFRKFAVASGSTPRAIAGSPPSFLYVGRHSLVKGIDVLVDALVMLPTLTYLDWRFVIAGDGELTPELKSKIEAAGLSAKVRFAGRVPDSQLPSYYEGADCVVIPSRSESIPLVLGESLQVGRPLIVTDVGDMGMLVRRHGLGVVVEKENPRALAESLAAFVQSPVKLEPHGRDELLHELMIENAAPRLLRRIEELVQ